MYNNLASEFWILMDYKHIYFLDSDLKYKSYLTNKNFYSKMPVKVIVDKNDNDNYCFELIDGFKVAKTWIVRPPYKNDKFYIEEPSLYPNPLIQEDMHFPKQFSLNLEKKEIPGGFNVCIDNYIDRIGELCWQMPYTAYRSYDGYYYCNDKLGKIMTEKEAYEYLKRHKNEAIEFLDNVNLASENINLHNLLYSADLSEYNENVVKEYNGLKLVKKIR